MKGLEALEHIAKDDFNMIITTYPPQKAFDGITKGDMVEIIEKSLKAFEILSDCDVDIWLLKHCDYENYCRIRRLCLEATGNADKCVDCDKEIIHLPTEEEFNELKEILL